MGYKNKGLCLLFAVCSIMMMPTLSFAADGLLWRIVNEDEKKELIPSFENQKSPFPILSRPEPVREVVFEPEMPTEPTEEERRSMLASDVLADIRALLENEEVFNPDITTAKVSASMYGEGGRLVLISNQWLKEGDMLKVPVRAKNQLNYLIRSLEELDPSLASLIKDDVQKRHEEAKDLQLEINEIGDGFINLSDDRGSLHVINFQI